MVLAHVVDTDLSGRTVVVLRTIPVGALVVLTDLSVTLCRGCCIVLRTPARRATLACYTLVTVGAGLADIPVGAIVGAHFCAVAVAAECSRFARTGSAGAFVAILCGLAGVVVVPLHTRGVTNLDG